MSRSSTFIIAEAGVNHNGSIETAKKMVGVAAEAGADAIKFQTFKAEEVISRFAPKAEYQEKNTDRNETQLDMVMNLELDREEHIELKKYCKKKSIIFLSSPFDLGSIDLLEELDCEILKIPSGEITNLPYLKKVGGLEKKILLSTGMANLKEIGDALEILIEAGTKKDSITVLHCNTEYPTPMADVNLLAMKTIKETFNVNVGYSDHTEGIEVSIAATALGATVIEKHFTIDKNMEGPDHRASLEPSELRAMVEAIRNTEKMLGDGIKKPSLSEKDNMCVVRKSIVTTRDVKKGEIIKEEDITAKRPGSGISPMEWEKIVGRAASRDFCKDELIKM